MSVSFNAPGVDKTDSTKAPSLEYLVSRLRRASRTPQAAEYNAEIWFDAQLRLYERYVEGKSTRGVRKQFYYRRCHTCGKQISPLLVIKQPGIKTCNSECQRIQRRRDDRIAARRKTLSRPMDDIPEQECSACSEMIPKDRLRLYPNTKTCNSECSKRLHSARAAVYRERKKTSIPDAGHLTFGPSVTCDVATGKALRNQKVLI